MFAIAILLSSLTLAALYYATSPARLTLGNAARIHEGVRLVGLILVFAIVASSFISLLIPSPWS